MNTMLFIKCGYLLVIGATAFTTQIRADTPAFTLGTVSTIPPSSFTGTRGWEFGRLGTPNDILITQLGVFDSGGDGLINPHAIGLWRAIDNLSGTLLASATVPAGTEAPILGGYRWVSITPVRIPFTLAFYTVGAQYSTGDADDMVTPHPAQFAPDIGLLQANGKVALGPELAFPAAYWGAPCEGCPAERFFEANFQYTVIPEPSVWFLLPPALGLLFLRLRKPH